MINPAPTQLDEALSAEWLGSAIAQSFPGVRIKEVRIAETIVTMATKVRLEVDYEAAPSDAPRHLCLKGLFGDHVGRMRSSGVMETEARFYQEIAPSVAMRLPEFVYGRVADDGPYAVVLMEDVIVRKGARFLTALNAYSVDQAAASLEQLSSLHAACWQGRGLSRFPWLTSRVAYFANNPPVPADELQSMMDGERGAPLPPAVRDTSRQLPALAKLVDRIPDNAHNLVHGDCHAGNVYETAEGPSFVDWQLLQRSSWALDLAYHIAAVLSVEEREASERHLISHYLDSLRGQGVEAPTPEVAWTEYRAFMAYGFHMWSITRKVDPEITNEFVKRLGLAVASLGSFDLLGV